MMEEELLERIRDRLEVIEDALKNMDQRLALLEQGVDSPAISALRNEVDRLWSVATGELSWLQGIRQVFRIPEPFNHQGDGLIRKGLESEPTEQQKSNRG